jgi:hypothetical protein
MTAIGRISGLIMLASLLACATGTEGTPDSMGMLGRPGDACQSDGDCAGIPCVDEVCCNTRCSGVCEACNLAGSAGTCAPIPAGEDPAEECGSVSCDGYVRGWNGSNCHSASAVSAEQAACNGARACRSVDEECALSDPGPVDATCNALCQVPDLSTCTGTTGGACFNVDQGTETCGLGACQVTTPRCLDGAPVVCTPNSSASSPEVCNGVDDDCDGMIDEDWAEPNESCAALASLATVYSGQNQEYRNLSLHREGDVDYFQFMATETPSACRCCDGASCLDEDYRLYIFLTVPEGAGSYRLCSGRTCGAVDTQCVEVPAGQNRALIWDLDGTCTATDSYEFFVRVHGQAAPGFICAPYFLGYEFVKGCYGAN